MGGAAPGAAMIIHPGFIKTGTTSLQQFLFGAHPQLHAFGHPHQSPLDTRLSGALRAIDGFGDEPQVLGAAVADAVAAWPVGRVPLLSDETLTADPRLAAATARRLHRHFPQARILFTLRRQEDLIRSFYGRHGRVLGDAPAPYTNRHVSFAAWLEHASRQAPAGVLGMADFARTIELYRGLFGTERISIVLLEEWMADPDAFARRLSAILGVDAGTTRRLLGDRRTHRQERARMVGYDRFGKRFPMVARLATRLPRGVRGVAGAFLRRGATQRVEWPTGWRERLRERYAPGNRELVERYGLPLREHGYAL